MKIYIYELLCPLTGEVRYIGKSINPEARYQRHIYDSRSEDTYKSRWIKKLEAQGLKPVLRIAVVLSADDNWQEAEKQAISIGFSLGLRLTNTSAGGEGVLIVCPNVEQRRIEATRRAWENPELRKRQSESLRLAFNKPELRKASRDRMKKRWENPEYVAEQSRVLKEIYSTPEMKAAQSERSKAAHALPGAKERRSKAQKESWLGEGVKEARVAKMVEGMQNPESRAKISESLRQRHKDPAKKAKQMSGLSDPEMIARRNEAIKAAWAKRLARISADPELAAENLRKKQEQGRNSYTEKSRSAPFTPEARAKRSASLREYHARRKAAKLAQSAPV